MSVEKYIGGVKLNYDNYPGKDYYSDGIIEDVLLDIVKNHEEQEFNSIIDEKKIMGGDVSSFGYKTEYSRMASD